MTRIACKKIERVIASTLPRLSGQTAVSPTELSRGVLNHAEWTMKGERAGLEIFGILEGAAR